MSLTKIGKQIGWTAVFALGVQALYLCFVVTFRPDDAEVAFAQGAGVIERCLEGILIGILAEISDRILDVKKRLKGRELS